MSTFTEALKIAQIHADRLQYAMAALKTYFPISAETIERLSNEEIAIFELYTSRFSKLQDFMGSKLFNMFLDQVGELFPQMTLIDKINKLEQLGIIGHAQDWTLMRQIRDHLSHEYPNHPELTAQYLNQAYSTGPILLDCLQKLTNHT